MTFRRHRHMCFIRWELAAFSCSVNTGLAWLNFSTVQKCLLWPYWKITGAYKDARAAAQLWPSCMHRRPSSIECWPSYPGQHLSSSDGPASSPLGLVRRILLPDALSGRVGVWRKKKLMFCLPCSRKDCWMLRNLNVRMNWLGQRLAAYVSRVRWSTYRKQIVFYFSVHQGNNF